MPTKPSKVLKSKPEEEEAATNVPRILFVYWGLWVLRKGASGAIVSLFNSKVLTWVYVSYFVRSHLISINRQPACRGCYSARQDDDDDDDDVALTFMWHPRRRNSFTAYLAALLSLLRLLMSLLPTTSFKWLLLYELIKKEVLVVHPILLE